MIMVESGLIKKPKYYYYWPKAPCQSFMIPPDIVSFMSQWMNTRLMQMQLLPDLGTSWYTSFFACEKPGLVKYAEVVLSRKPWQPKYNLGKNKWLVRMGFMAYQPL